MRFCTGDLRFFASAVRSRFCCRSSNLYSAVAAELFLSHNATWAGEEGCLALKIRLCHARVHC
jgi:hypothetical protein